MKQPKLYIKNENMSKKIEFIDLGLPSGKLWATENEEGYFTYDEAKEKFGELLPKPKAFEELWKECRWRWDIKNNGMIVVGPNKNTIFLPAYGFRGIASGELKSVGSDGWYWTYEAYDLTNACSFGFYSVRVFPMCRIFCEYGFSVRLCREV